jgi:hypothetical protein
MDTTKPITPDMKVKWRAHELLFVTLFVALKLVSHVWEMLALTGYEARILYCCV